MLLSSTCETTDGRWWPCISPGCTCRRTGRTRCRRSRRNHRGPEPGEVVSGDIDAQLSHLADQVVHDEQGFDRVWDRFRIAKGLHLRRDAALQTHDPFELQAISAAHHAKALRALAGELVKERLREAPVPWAARPDLGAGLQQHAIVPRRRLPAGRPQGGCGSAVVVRARITTSRSKESRPARACSSDPTSSPPRPT